MTIEVLHAATGSCKLRMIIELTQIIYVSSMCRETDLTQASHSTCITTRTVISMFRSVYSRLTII